MTETRDALNKLLVLSRPRRAIAVALVVLGLAASLSEGIGIGLFIPFLDNLAASQSGVASDTWLGRSLAGFFDGVSAERRLFVIAAAIFVAVLFKAVLNYATDVLSISLSAKIANELRKRVLEEVLTADFRVINKLGTGRLLNVLSNEGWRTADAVTTMFHLVISFGTLFVYVALLLAISWELTIIIAVALVLISLGIRLLTNKVSSLGRRTTEENDRVLGRMVDSIDGIEIIRGYGHEDHERQQFSSTSDRLAKLIIRTGVLSGAVHPLYEVLAAAVLVTVLLMAGQAGTSVASVLVFVFLLYRLVPVVKQLERERVELLASIGAIDETFSLLARSDTRYLRDGTVTHKKLRSELRLEQVSYQYDEEDTSPALQNVSFEIPAKGLTAIVGPSGAGKSTLLKLLLRFFDPSEGQVLVDGKPLSDLVLETWRRGVSVVPQRAFLFNATIRDNIAYGNLNASDVEICAAAQMAGAHEFVLNLTDGYDTRLGVDGVELSGGEAQRLCLARALIRKPDLLLLDEATNALDSISEELIQRAIDKMRDDCGVVVIAHRLATIENADQILVLNDGRLLEAGELKHLVAQGGLFAELYERQRF